MNNMLLFNLSKVYICYLYFFYLFTPVFVFIIFNKNRWRLRNSGVLSLALGLTTLIYPAIYYLLRLFLNYEKAIIVSRFLPIVFLISIILSYRKEIKHLLGYLAGLICLLKSKKVIYYVLMMLLYAGITSAYLFRNGYTEDGRLVTYDLFSTEVFHHLTLAQDLKYDIHPQTMHYIPADRSHYHYGSNLLIHYIAELAGCPYLFCVFVYFFVPLMVTVLGIAIFSFTLEIWNKYWIAFTAVFVSLFCYDFSALILWIRGLVVEHHWFFGSSLPGLLSVWTPIITQFQLFHNPSYLYSTAIFFIALHLTIKFEKYPDFVLFLLATITWVVLLKAKITAFLVGMAGLLFYSMANVLFNKNYRVFFLLISVLLLSAPFVISAVGGVKNGFEFSKWFFPGNFGYRAHIINEHTYQRILKNGFPDTWFGWFSFFLAFIIYYIGLINIKILIFIRKYKWDRIKNLLIKPDVHTLLLGLLGAGMTAFVFIVNDLRKHDSMWFYLLVLYILNIYLAHWLMDFFRARFRFRFIIAGFITFLIGTAALSFIIPALSPGYSLFKEYSSAEIEAYDRLYHEPSDKRIITRYYDLYKYNDEGNMAVQALSGKPVVSEGLYYNFAYVSGDSIFIKKVKNVRSDILKLYSTTEPDTAIEILHRYDAGYIIIKKPDSLRFSFNCILDTLYYKDEILLLKLRNM